MTFSKAQFLQEYIWDQPVHFYTAKMAMHTYTVRKEVGCMDSDVLQIILSYNVTK